MNEFLVDKGDEHLLQEHNCYFDGRYVCYRIGQKKFYIHRVIMKVNKGTQVDHVNGDKLDNRRSNLRIATQSQNNMNRSKVNNKHGYKGIYYYGDYYRKKTNLKTEVNHWRARIKLDGKYIYLGSFDTKEEAALAYNEGARKYFGEYASLNQI